MVPGALVKILPPFDAAFPGTFIIRAVEGTTVFLDGIPDGFAEAFDFSYVELV